MCSSTWRGRRVALKLFRADKSPDGHSRDEIAIALSLSDRNLIRVLGQMQVPLGLVMEYVDGKPLAEKPNFEVRKLVPPTPAAGPALLIGAPPSGSCVHLLPPTQFLLRCRWAPGQTFQLPWLVRVAHGVAGALEHMHYRGICHGDVYAHNVLADEQGHATLCDYGERAGRGGVGRCAASPQACTHAADRPPRAPRAPRLRCRRVLPLPQGRPSALRGARGARIRAAAG